MQQNEYETSQIIDELTVEVMTQTMDNNNTIGTEMSEETIQSMFRYLFENNNIQNSRISEIITSEPATDTMWLVKSSDFISVLKDYYKERDFNWLSNNIRR